MTRPPKMMIPGSPRLGGSAKVGGIWRPPIYGDAYVHAARVILERATREEILDEMAMPCLYLQRHALELLVKDLIELTYDVQASTDSLAAAKEVAPKKVKMEHDISACTKRLAKALNELGPGYSSADLPPDLTKLSEEIATFEDGDETRSRYRRGVRRPKRPNDYSARSFPTAVSIPLSNWQDRLERLYETLTPGPHPGGATSLAQYLTEDHEAAFQEGLETGLWHLE